MIFWQRGNWRFHAYSINEHDADERLLILGFDMHYFKGVVSYSTLEKASFQHTIDFWFDLFRRRLCVGLEYIKPVPYVKRERRIRRKVAK